jgi:hypothetical protein
MVVVLVMDYQIPTPAALQAVEVVVDWRALVVTSYLCHHQNLH